MCLSEKRTVIKCDMIKKKSLNNNYENNNNMKNLIKGDFEWTAVWIPLFNLLIASAAVIFLLAFQLENK